MQILPDPFLLLHERGFPELPVHTDRNYSGFSSEDPPVSSLCIFVKRCILIALTAILSFYFLSVCTVLYLLPQSCQQVFDPCASIRILTGFTIILADNGHTSSNTSRPFSRRVDPVSTISTITSDSPTIGASSMEPFNLMISTV